MAELVKDEGGDKKFPKEPVDKELLLSSLRDYKKDGVAIGVEKVIEPKLNAYGKVTISTILTIIGSMPKCRQYILDEEGQYTFYIDDKTGDERRDIKVDDGQLCTVFFPFYAVPKGDGLDENTTLLITPGTSSYSFFKCAFISAEELPSDMGEQAFTTNFKELKEVLDGFTFIGKYAVGGSKRKFNYLECEQIKEEI